MKTEIKQEKTATRGKIWTVVVVFALCLGLGVTGALLWAENRPKPPVARAPLSVPAPAPLPDLAGLRVAPGMQNQVPAASVTAGMTPRQAALTLANWYYDHHEHEMAVRSFRRAIALGVTHPNVRTDLGNALRLNGQPEEALKQYQIAQQQDLVHEQSLFNQGALYAASLKNPKRAVEVWRLYLKRFPKGAQAAQARQLIAKYSVK